MPHTNKANNVYHFQIHRGQVQNFKISFWKIHTDKMNGICKDLVKIFVQSNLKLNIYDLLPMNISLNLKTNHTRTIAIMHASEVAEHQPLWFSPKCHKQLCCVGI